MMQQSETTQWCAPARRFFNTTVSVLTIVGVSSFAIAQDDPPPAEETTKSTESAVEDEKNDPPPSLDDLLGIDDEDDEATESDDADTATNDDDQLDRALSEEDIASAFLEALAEMKVCATLLDESFDTGLETQRLQQDILSKLDSLIDQAAKQDSSSSSSSSSSQQQQQQQNPGMQQQNQDQQQQEQSASERNEDSSDAQEGDPPPLQSGDLNTMIDETRSEWGNLPDRVRDMLLQGRREKYSSLYERMTREYYRRLAEEGSK